MASPVYVFFDVDDTLVQWKVDWAAAFAQAAREAGAEVAREQAWHALNIAFSTFYGDYLRKHSEAGDEREFWLDYNRRIFQMLGVEEGPSRAAERAAELLKRPDSIQLFPEVPEVLETLAGRGARLGILTGRPRAKPDLEALGVLGYFEVVMDGLWAGEAKGVGAAMFRRAAEVVAESGAVGWHVGDSYEHDVEAARAAGLRGVLVDRRGRHEGADCPRIGDLGGLLGMLREQGAIG